MRIHKFKLSNLRNYEHFQFMTDLRRLFGDEMAGKMKVQGPYDTWLALYKKEDELLKKIMKSAITGRIHELDGERDGVFRGLTDVCRAAVNHYEAGVREAAVRLRIPLEAYGDLTGKGIAEETAAIYNLLQELVQKHGADVETVGLGGWIAELDRLNNALEKLWIERFSETAGRGEATMKDARAAVDEAYRVLTLCVEAFSEMAAGGADAAVYETFIASLNAVTDRYNAVLAARRTRAEHDREKDEEANRPAEPQE